MQRFCKEVVTWRTLRHPNILPLIGVMMTESQFAMISDWMENGNINEFVKANPEADKFGLVCLPLPSPLDVPGRSNNLSSWEKSLQG